MTFTRSELVILGTLVGKAERAQVAIQAKAVKRERSISTISNMERHRATLAALRQKIANALAEDIKA